jgi:hypothetical protein
MIPGLKDFADRYNNDANFHSLVSLIENALRQGQYSIQEFREATTYAAWRVADDIVYPYQKYPRPYK